MIKSLDASSVWGTTVRSLETGGMRFAEVVVAPGPVSGVNHRANPCLAMPLETTSEIEKDATATDEPPAVVFYPADLAGANHNMQDVRTFVVELLPEREKSMADELALEAPVTFRRSPVVTIMQRLYREFLSEQNLSHIALEGLALEAFVTALRLAGERQARTPAWLAESHTIIHERFAEKLSLREIGNQVGIHPAHLARAFRERFGCTIGELLRQLRVDLARRQLVESTDSIRQIATATGFADQSHLTRVFQKLVGITPAAYRRAHRRRLIF